MTKDKREAPVRPPTPPLGNCAIFLAPKRRYCRLLTLPGARFCAAHDTSLVAVDGEPRVECPYEPGVLINQSSFKKHLRICNLRPRPVPAYTVSGINRAPGESSEKKPQRTNAAILDAMPVEAVLVLCEKIDRLYNLHVLGNGARADLPDATSETPDFLNLSIGMLHLGKHPVQVSSLLALLSAQSRLDPAKVFAEFGCGKADLSRFVNASLAAPSDFLLIDRSNSRNKVDAGMRKHRHSSSASEGSEIHRLKMDIADLDLTQAPALSDSPTRPVVAYSKHLCGPATDLTLRCLANFASKGGQIDSVLIALCCHQRCTVDSLAGKEFLVGEKDDQLTEDEFAAACVMSTWTLSWFKSPDLADPEPTSDSDNDDPSSDIPKSHFPAQGHWTTLTKPALEKIGFQCKRLFDWARIKWFEQHGFQAELKYYVDRKWTPENVVLLARRV